MTFEEHLRAKGYAATTIRSYVAIVKRWLRTRLPAAEWLRRQRERSARGGGPTESSKVYEHALVAYHRARGLPVDGLRQPRVLRYTHPHAQRALERAEEDALRAYLEGPAEPEPGRTWARLLLDTGLRRDEARRLRLGDVRTTREGPVLAVLGKGGKPRDVPLPPRAAGALVAYLRGWRASQPGPWLFPSPQGRTDAPASCRVLRDVLDRARRALGVERLTPHTLRHSTATRMQEAGVPIEIVGAVLGHTSTATTRRYLHPGLSLCRAALARAGR